MHDGVSAGGARASAAAHDQLLFQQAEGDESSSAQLPRSARRRCVATNATRGRQPRLLVPTRHLQTGVTSVKLYSPVSSPVPKNVMVLQRCSRRGIEHDSPISRYYERLATVQCRGSQASHQVLRDILREVCAFQTALNRSKVLTSFVSLIRFNRTKRRALFSRSGLPRPSPTRPTTGRSARM